MIAEIKSEGSVTGTIIANNAVLDDAIIGKVNIAEYPVYTGEVEVTPNSTGQTLQTANKSLLSDIDIKAIPYFNVANEYGRTIYIGGSIN